MTAPTIGAFPLPQQPGRRPGPVTAGAADRPSPEHAAAVVEQLLHLAGQVRGWQHALLRTPDEVGARTGVLTADPYGVPPGPALRAGGSATSHSASIRSRARALAAPPGTASAYSVPSGAVMIAIASAPAVMTRSPRVPLSTAPAVLVTRTAPISASARARADPVSGA